jgi:hypothetical protein
MTELTGAINRPPQPFKIPSVRKFVTGIFSHSEAKAITKPITKIKKDTRISGNMADARLAADLAADLSRLNGGEYVDPLPLKYTLYARRNFALRNAKSTTRPKK